MATSSSGRAGRRWRDEQGADQEGVHQDAERQAEAAGAPTTHASSTSHRNRTAKEPIAPKANVENPHRIWLPGLPELGCGGLQRRQATAIGECQVWTGRQAGILRVHQSVSSR